MLNGRLGDIPARLAFPVPESSPSRRGSEDLVMAVLAVRLGMIEGSTGEAVRWKSVRLEGSTLPNTIDCVRRSMHTVMARCQKTLAN